MSSPTTTPAATPAAPSFSPAPARLVPRASLVLLVLALVVCVLADLPLLGWGVAAGLWALSAVLHAWTRSTAAKASPNAAIGLAAAAMFVRTAVAMGALLYVGVSANVDDTTFGLGQPDAAIVALVLYTLVFTLDMGERIGSDVSSRHTTISAPREEGTEA
jgi:hypothetical protein